MLLLTLCKRMSPAPEHLLLSLKREPHRRFEDWESHESLDATTAPVAVAGKVRVLGMGTTSRKQMLG